MPETQPARLKQPVKRPPLVRVAEPEEKIPEEKRERNTTPKPSPGPRRYALPPWPTSQPGPEVTLPGPGQFLVAGRTDQVAYDSYDQERGQPNLSPSSLPAIQTERNADEPLVVVQTDSLASQEAMPSPEPEPALHDRVTTGQLVFDVLGARVGKVATRFPLYMLVERGWIFPQVYYVPLALISHFKEQALWLSISQKELTAQDFAQIPQAINDLPAPPASEDRIDISDVSSLGMSALSPAETGHYHYGPHSPGMNTDAGGSYTPAEVDPRGRLRDRPARLYITGKRLRSLDK